MSVSSPSSPALTKSCSGSWDLALLGFMGSVAMGSHVGRKALSPYSREKSEAPFPFEFHRWRLKTEQVPPSQQSLQERRWVPTWDAHGSSEDGTKVRAQKKSPSSFSGLSLWLKHQRHPLFPEETRLTGRERWGGTFGQSCLPTGSMRRIRGGATVFSDRCWDGCVCVHACVCSV